MILHPHCVGDDDGGWDDGGWTYQGITSCGTIIDALGIFYTGATVVGIVTGWRSAAVRTGHRKSCCMWWQVKNARDCPLLTVAFMPLTRRPPPCPQFCPRNEVRAL